MKIKAQMLYDLRTMTGFISGDDLHNLFREVLGEPSPSGYMEFEVSALSNARYGEKALAELKREFNYKVIADIAWYVLGSPVGQIDMRMEEAIEYYKKKYHVRLLNAIRENFGINKEIIAAEMVEPLFEKSLLAVIPELSDMLGISQDFNWLS